MALTARLIAALASPLVLAALPTDAARAQVAAGTAIVGTAVGPQSSGTSGLFLVPLAGGPTTPITGLPSALSLPSGGSFVEGVSSVAHRTTDGAIVVGTAGDSAGPHGGAVEVFVLHLNGGTVDPARTQQVLLGTTTNRGGALVVPLPDGRLLVGAGQNNSPLPSGPMAGHLLAILELPRPNQPNPSFRLLPDPGLSQGNIGGLAVDPTGRFAYLLLTSNGTGELYRLELETNQVQVCPIASWPGEFVFGVTVDHDGTVYVGTMDPARIRTHYHAVTPDGCNPAAVVSVRGSAALPPWGLALDRRGARYVVAAGPFGPGFPSSYFNALWLVDPATGGTTLAASPPAGGWGVMGRAGVAVHHAMAGYGAPSDRLARYWFQNFPNPGGPPTLGNAGFSLTTRATSAPLLSSLVLSFGLASLEIEGVEVLVDPATASAALVPSPGATALHPLPLPADPSFAGLRFTAQSFHLEFDLGIAASAGLIVTLL